MSAPPASEVARLSVISIPTSHVSSLLEMTSNFLGRRGAALVGHPTPTGWFTLLAAWVGSGWNSQDLAPAANHQVALSPAGLLPASRPPRWPCLDGCSELALRLGLQKPTGSPVL